MEKDKGDLDRDKEEILDEDEPDWVGCLSVHGECSFSYVIWRLGRGFGGIGIILQTLGLRCNARFKGSLFIILDSFQLACKSQMMTAVQQRISGRN